MMSQDTAWVFARRGDPASLRLADLAHNLRQFNGHITPAEILLLANEMDQLSVTVRRMEAALDGIVGEAQDRADAIASDTKIQRLPTRPRPRVAG